MKAVCYWKIYFIISIFSYINLEAPEVEVNYLPKKQWKMSKHDMADLKVDIEKELRSKILQMQMEWTKKQRMEEYILQNQIMNASLNMPTRQGILNNFSNINYLPENNYPKFLEKSNSIELDTSKVTDSSILEPQKQDDIDLIVNKYTSKNADTEIDLFTSNFRNYNSTSQDVDIKSIKTKISELAKQINFNGNRNNAKGVLNNS
jgi:hypothetical protein